MEQLVILVLIGLISLINWIVQKSAEARAKRKLAKQEEPKEESFMASELPSDPAESQEPAPFSERSASGADEAMRNLMDALGLELPAVPEPEVVTPPPMPTSLEQMAAEMETNAPAFEEELPPKTIRRTPKPRIPRPLRSHSRVGELLAAPGGVRNGVVLSEILGPPKGLR